MSIFQRKNQEPPKIDVHGDEATINSGADPRPEDFLAPPEPPRGAKQVQLPKTTWA